MERYQQIWLPAFAGMTTGDSAFDEYALGGHWESEAPASSSSKARSPSR